MTVQKELPQTGPHRIFRDRREAGQVLGGLLAAYRDRPGVVVLGLARGGIPVAWEVAAALDAPLDTLVVRKLGVPGREEVALGAIASGGRLVLNDDLIRGLRVTPGQLREVAVREGRELLRREAAYRGDLPPVDVSGKTVILVDDGLATAASMLVAIEALRDAEPARLVVAVPAAPQSTCRQVGDLVDEMVCATMPSPFTAVGASFWNFRQVSDEEARELLHTPTHVTGRPTRLAPGSAVAMVAIDAPGGVPPRAELDDLIGDARIVLIGESSHGTHEFYSARAEMTKWLIEEKGFCAVAAEADWPDALRVDRYVRGLGEDASADDALSGFERFPAWMWRNTVVRDFVDWLADRNQRSDTKAGFYGLDLYSLHRSMHEVVAYLETVDPLAAERARKRYACFDHLAADDGQSYGFAAAFGAGESCERQAVEQLVDMRSSALTYARNGDPEEDDAAFYAERNAWAVRNAEEYYRTMFAGRVSSWNLRDQHMAQTLDALVTHLELRSRSAARIVVWAHNSHVGDARATEVATEGQVNLGQLARQRYGQACRLIGFSTFGGTVTAAGEWGGVAQRKVVVPALAGSVEELFHETDIKEFLVRCDVDGAAADAMRTVRLARAIGVIYSPQTERQSHYYHVRPADQFDAVIHIDRTRAVEPLDPTSRWIEGETPETYPSGL
jgi:erythromycin esterase-like protein/predicted phosphoribosyltransferase